MPNSRGHQPCTELETRAGIWRYEAERTGQRFSPVERFVTGLRNAGGVAVDSTGVGIYATQHGRDQLAENWPHSTSRVAPRTDRQDSPSGPTARSTSRTMRTAESGVSSTRVTLRRHAARRHPLHPSARQRPRPLPSASSRPRASIPTPASIPRACRRPGAQRRQWSRRATVSSTPTRAWDATAPTRRARGSDLTKGKWLWGDGSLAAIARTITQGVPRPKEHTGVMPPMGGAQLSPSDVSALAAYLAALSQQAER
jgi:mono/diheme cytochrome c family protein